MGIYPDYYFTSVSCVPARFLLGIGIKGLLIDLDNTLTADGSQHLSEDISGWVKKIKSAGIRLLIISNNHEPRVRPFAESAGMRYLCEAGKPAGRCLGEALGLLGVKKHEAAVIGDQLFTDILFAKRCGIISVLVEPVGEDRHAGAGVKRFFERPVRKRLKRREHDKDR